MDWPVVGRAALSVAPDRHVVAASIQLGLVEAGAREASLPLAVADRWSEALAGAPLLPIDLHTAARRWPWRARSGSSRSAAGTLPAGFHRASGCEAPKRQA
ncbi:MAG TPA: hypothetical protein VGG29_08885 [Caulobacteraceae bacterium]